ncbi:alpha/beta hydrolase fold protein [Tanacetum coccineum]
MAPTNLKKTKHKPETTKAGEQVLDLVIPYIHDIEDRNSVSLVSRKSYETDGITHGYVIRFTPWIEQLALEFRCLKELHICGLVVCDEDLETLMRTRGKDLRSLKISKCKGFSTHGLRHVSNYCNQLRTLCLKYPEGLEYCDYIQVKDDIWIHQLALNSTVLERLHVKNIDFSNNAQQLMLLAKNCCNSLISLKIGECRLSKLGDAFRYAVRLEHFSGENLDEEFDLVGFQLPPHMRSLRIECLPPTRYSIVLPCLNQIRKLELVHFSAAYMCQCSLFKMCPNVEVLYPADECGDTGLQVIGKFCKKLPKLTHYGLMTYAGLMDLAKGCTKLECLEVRLTDISNEALECLGTHLKNLRKFRMHLAKEYGTIDPPLDNGIRAMLMGCRKLESLDISLCHEGWTDVGLDYIGKYGANVKSLSLTQ